MVLDTHDHWQVLRSPDSPIIRPDMPGLIGEDGANINGPSLIRVPEWVVNPLGRYYLYFSHRGLYIRLACSDAIEGPWWVHPGGTLRLEQTAAAGRAHLSSYDAQINLRVGLTRRGQRSSLLRLCSDANTMRRHSRGPLELKASPPEEGKERYQSP